MSSITPYKISVSDERMKRLEQKLQLASFPDELDDAGWDYGAPLADIKRLASYWRDHYDWRKHERILNDLPQFRTLVTVDGFGSLDIHFVHQTSKVGGAIPLLFVHGWPGSFIEVSRIIGSLAEGRGNAPAFHVVAPSLPNFGFSQGVSKKGFNLPQYGEACHHLMQRLGYSEYVTQGGDWGTWITRCMAKIYPASKALHINMIVGKPPAFTKDPLLALQHALTPYSEREKKGLDRLRAFYKTGRGYSGEQSTKPQTLGYALHDSPVGLLAWIYEKLHDWTDDYPWTDDEILTWVSIYWFSTAGPASSLRIYHEATSEAVKLRSYVPGKPLGLAYFPRDIYPVPKAWGMTLGPVVHQSEHESGGHFATWERPQAIVKDLQTMFGKGGGAYGVVEGKDGYDVSRARI